MWNSSKGRWGELHNDLERALVPLLRARQERGALRRTLHAAFVLAALAALLLLLRRPREMRSADHMLLIALVFVIGLGSLAVDLLAHEASLLADMIPIDAFNSSLLAASRPV